MGRLPKRTTSILPQLRYYRRLKIIATFAAVGSLGSVVEAATAAICRALAAIGRATFDKNGKKYIVSFVEFCRKKIAVFFCLASFNK